MLLRRFICSPKVIFIALSIACILALAGSFLSWNQAKTFDGSQYDALDSGNLKFSIDSCTVLRNEASVKGWIFNDAYPESGSLIVTISTTTGEYIVPSFTFTRGDVSQIFSRNNLFDKVGFNASISNMFIGDSKNGRFNFYIKDKNGNVKKALSYVCNK